LAQPSFELKFYQSLFDIKGYEDIIRCLFLFLKLIFLELILITTDYDI